MIKKLHSTLIAFVEGSPGSILVQLLCYPQIDVMIAAYSLVDSLIIIKESRSFLFSLNIMQMIIDECYKMISSESVNNELLFLVLDCIGDWCKMSKKEELAVNEKQLSEFLSFCFECDKFHLIYKPLFKIVYNTIDKTSVNIVEMLNFIQRAFNEFLVDPLFNDAINFTAQIVSSIFYDESTSPTDLLIEFPISKLPSIFHRTKDVPVFINSIIIMLSNISFSPSFVQAILESPEAINAIIELYGDVGTPTRIEIINLFWIFAKNDDSLLALLHSGAIEIMTVIFQMEDEGLIEVVRTCVFDTLRKLAAEGSIDEEIGEPFHDAIVDAIENGNEKMQEIAESILNEIFPEEGD